MLFRADAGHASNVCENDLSYFHFKRVQNQLYVGRTEKEVDSEEKGDRKVDIQN